MFCRLKQTVFCLCISFYALNVVAQTEGESRANEESVQIEINKEKPSATNEAELTTEDGYDVWVNGLAGFSGSLTNTGSLKVTGNGWGIYETAYQVTPVQFKLTNKGTIQRIQLEQIDNQNDDLTQNGTIDWLSLRPGLISPTAIDNDRNNFTGSSTNLITNTEQGTIQGSALFGVNTIVYNEGKFENFDLDKNREKGNLVAFGYNGRFLNGIDWTFKYDQKGMPIELASVTFAPSANLTTDKVQFAYQGMLLNGGIINNKSLTFGDSGYLYNVGNGYDKENIGELPEYGATITTENLIMGKNSLLINEMGTYFTANEIQMGDGSFVSLGDDYNLYVEKTESITVTDSTGEVTTEEVSLPTFPHKAKMNVSKATFGNNSSFSILNDAVYTGQTMTFKNNGVFSMKSGDMKLQNNGNGLLSFGDNAQIDINAMVQQFPVLTDTDAKDTGDEEDAEDMVGAEDMADAEDGDTKTAPTYRIVNKFLDANLTVDTFQTGTGALINMGIEDVCIEGAGCAHVNVNVNQGLFGDQTHMVLGDINVKLTAENSLSFGNTSILENGKNEDKSNPVISSPLITFADNGVLINKGTINGENLIMGQNSRIDNYKTISLTTTFGSNSTANLIWGSPVDFNYRRGSVSPQFTGGVQKAEGATGVHIVNQTGIDSEGGPIAGYITGGINVDSILVDTGELQMSGDVRGVIGINTDAQLRLVDTGVFIHDPISKLSDATNTKLIIDLEGDRTFYTTSNTINVDHILVAGGGFEINNPVQANEIRLESNTGVRLNDNWYSGDIVEMHGDAVNTTLDINANGKTIYSPGVIRVDRVVVESGTFDINHTVEATYKSESSVMPLTNESGLELNSNTVVNVNANDVNVNRIVREQLASTDGKVENTTVNVNGGKITVERNTDVDQLNINGGTFEFKNTDTDNVINIGKNLSINHGGQIAGTGLMNIRDGSLDVNDGGRLSVSTESVYKKPLGVMEIMQSQTVYSDANDVTDKGHATVNFNAGSILDLRAKDKENDKIVVSGTVNLGEDMRIVLRDIKPNQEYELLSATQLNGDIEKIRTSFLWAGVAIKNADNVLSLKIDSLQTLKEAIQPTQHSINIDSIASAMDSINNRTASNTIDPFLDRVFYAFSADEAVKVMSQYSPEGYLNTQQVGLHVTRMFKAAASDELSDLRTYKEAYENRYLKARAVYNPNYYGRPGYESSYSNWSNRHGNQRRTRTDKGGIWVKPFMMRFSQDDNKNIAGYEFSNYGLTTGIDKRFGSLSLGLMGLYANGSMDQNNSLIKADMQTYGAGIYGYFRPYKSRQFLNLYALWTQTSNSAKHHINSLVESAKADFDMTTYAVGADFGVDIPVNPRFILTPKVGIDYAKASLDELSEKGDSAGLLKVAAEDYTSIQTPVELRAMLDLGNDSFRFKPEAHARWTHEFGDTKSTGQGLFVNYNQPFGIESVAVDKDTFTLGGSLLWLYAVSELELKYDYDFSSSSTGHSLNASYKYLF